MNDFERRILKLAPVRTADVVRLMERQHHHVNRVLRDNKGKLNPKGELFVKRCAYVLLIDSLDVQRDGMTRIEDV